MRSSIIAVSIFTVCGLVFAQDAGEFQTWMKTAGATSGSLRRNLEAKNGDAAAADAQKLSETFSHVHDYFAEKKVDQAMKFAMDAQSGFEETGKLAAAGKFEEASASLKKAQATCGECHTAYREKAADGTWKIKTE
jgi:soluble cytochrome b562